MRRLTCGLAMVVLMLAAKPAFGQFSLGALTKGTSTPNFPTNNMTGFLTASMNRPNVMAPVTRPNFPQMSIFSGGASLPNFGNILMMRNSFSTSPMSFGFGGGQTTPPPKK